MDNFSLLQPTQHMFEWFSPSPFKAIYDEVEDILCQQVADSRLEAFIVKTEPEWLTGGKQTDDNKMIVVRAGVAFEFELKVKASGKIHLLTGVFTWVGYHFDEPENTHIQTWLDIDGTLAEFGKDGALIKRIYLQ